MFKEKETMTTTLFLQSLESDTATEVLADARHFIINKTIEIGLAKARETRRGTPFYIWLTQELERLFVEIRGVGQLPLGIEPAPELIKTIGSNHKVLRWLHNEVEAAVMASSHFGDWAKMCKLNKNTMSNSFTNALNNNYEIKLDAVRTNVIDICVRADLIAESDRVKKSRRYLKLEEIINRNLLALGLLNELMLRHTDTPKGQAVDVDEWISAVVKNISRRVLDSDGLLTNK